MRLTMYLAKRFLESWVLPVILLPLAIVVLPFAWLAETFFELLDNFHRDEDK